jgi:hypothetical protein
MDNSRTKRRLIWLTTWVLLIVAAYLLWMETFGRRVVGRATARDGTKAYVVQTREWSATFAGKSKKFTTMFYVRRPNGKWRGFYGLFEDDRWQRGDCKMNVNGDRVVFYRKNVPAITFVWATEKYTLHAHPDYNGAPFDPDIVPVRW